MIDKQGDQRGGDKYLNPANQLFFQVKGFFVLLAVLTAGNGREGGFFWRAGFGLCFCFVRSVSGEILINADSAGLELFKHFVEILYGRIFRFWVFLVFIFHKFLLFDEWVYFAI